MGWVEEYTSDPANAVDPFGMRHGGPFSGGGLGGGLGGDLMSQLTGSDQTAAAIAAQAEATRLANETQRYMYDTTRSDLAPWRDAGARAIPQLENGDFQRDFTMSDFTKDPGYDFRMAEGAKALERSAAARGGLNSGGTMKALSRYGQDFASNEYTNAYNRYNADRDRRFNRLSAIAGIGQTANNEQVNSNSNYGNNVSANQIGQGNAAASAEIAQANRTSQMIGQGASMIPMLRASDRRLKENIEEISSDDLKELRSTLRPYKFNYKDEKYGVGDWIGVMAQDLKKSKLGRSLVVEDSDGFLKIDLQKLMCLFLATLAEV